MKWTEGQLRAINEKDKNILVSASAGSGKTAVLSERIIQIVKNERVDISKFLVVTFTNLAATEMRQRITTKLEELKELNKNDTFFEEQLYLIDMADISTLHSFGLKLIREYFYLMDLDADFRLLDEVEFKMMKKTAINKLFNKYYKEGNEDFLNALKMYGNIKNDKGLKKEINIIYEFLQSLKDPFEKFDTLLGPYKNSEEFVPSKSIYYEYIKANINRDIPSKVMMAEKLIPLSETLISDIKILEDIKVAAGISYGEVYDRLTNLSFDRIKYSKDLKQDEKELVKGFRDFYIKDYIKDLKEKYFTEEENVLKKDVEFMRPKIGFIAKLVKEYHEILQTEKSAKNVITFNDIEHLTYKLLKENKHVQNRVREDYKYVIIDEYQDINELQEAILVLVSKYKGSVPNMFMVGDVKQSIYRFRKADSEIFTSKYNSFSDESGNDLKIDLNQNFRSRREVLKFVNHMFEKIMRREIGDISYDENMKLVYGNLYREDREYDYRPEINIILKNEEELILIEDNEEGDEESLNEVLEEALFVARRINDLVTERFQIFDIKKGEYRDIRYSDIVILFRSMKKSSDIFYDTLMRCGINTFIADGEGFLNLIEIRQVISLLKVIDNPYQDINLVSVLYSAMFKFEPEELYEIKKQGGNVHSYFESVLKCVKVTRDEKLKEKIAFFINTLSTLRKYARSYNVSDLILKIYDITYFDDYMITYNNVRSKVKNLKELVRIAKDFGAGANKSLPDFIAYLDDIRLEGEDIKIESDTASFDAVRIMSIHKSKGLEFPVVFLPQLSKMFNQSDIKDKILLDKKIGIASSYIDVEEHMVKDNMLLGVLKSKIKLDNLAEEMRILYVAMTRAKERLILVSSLPDRESFTSKWKNKMLLNGNEIDTDYLIKVSNYLDLIGPIIEKDMNNNSAPYSINFINDLEKTQDSLTTNYDIREDIKKVSQNECEIWEYPYKNVFDKKQKISVTDLKKELGKESIYKVSTKMTEVLEGLSAAEVGSVVHKIFRHIDAKTEGELIEKMESLITKEEIESVSVEKLMNFYNSDLYKRIISSSYVKKEMPFMMKKEISEVYENIKDSNDYVIIQGIIDCVFMEEDEIVILDYKTDKISGDKEKKLEDLKNKYKIQLDLYEEAISAIFNKKVKEKLLYLVDINEVIEII